jgi:hypothetical protein
VLSQFFVPDPEIFPQLKGLKLEADGELIYVFDVDTDSATDDSKHPMVSVFITDTFIGKEVKPEKKHHQAWLELLPGCSVPSPIVFWNPMFARSSPLVLPLLMS